MNNTPLHFILLLLGLWTAAAVNAQPEANAATYRGAYFEVQYPAKFKAAPLEGTKPRESKGATFTSPDGTMTFYLFSPQWAGEAPGIALDASRETEISRKSDAGKSSGVAGTYTWTTIAAKDKSYTRTYQDFLASDGSIHWVMGMKYRDDAALQKYKAAYGRFKASLRQFGD
ncbi:MAG: hypothetical protein ABL931_02330 [Usitatibacteraceae bacterium]